MKSSKSGFGFGTSKKKLKKDVQGSIFNYAARNRFRNFEEGARKLTKAVSFRDIHNYAIDEEPGLYCKFPRITIMTKKNDALISYSADQLLQFIRDRANSESKSLVWIDIQGTHDQIGDIGKAFNLHPLTLEDCVVVDTREKISVTADYIFLCVHDVSLPGDKWANLNMIIFPDLLLTLHEKPLHSIYDVVPKLEYCDDTEIPSIEFIVYVILSSIISFYGASMEQVRQRADLLDEEVMKAAKVDKQEMSSLLGRLSAAVKRSSTLRDDINTKKDLLAALSRNDAIFSKKGLQYIKSAYDQVLKMDLQVGLLNDMLEDINEFYMGKISAQLAVVANDVGILTRQFAVITAIFLPAGLISGILGMNVNYPSLAEPHQSDFTPFGITMAIMIGLCLVQLYVYYKMKWL